MQFQNGDEELVLVTVSLLLLTTEPGGKLVSKAALTLPIILPTSNGLRKKIEARDSNKEFQQGEQSEIVSNIRIRTIKQHVTVHEVFFHSY